MWLLTVRLTSVHILNVNSLFKYERFQFSDNGLVQFQSVSENEKLLLPAPFPEGFNGNEDQPMLAVFWDDADLTLGDGKLLYQVSITIKNATFCGLASP